MFTKRSGIIGQTIYGHIAFVRHRSREERLEGSTEQVVSFVRGLIERGELRRGDRLPAERDLATQIGVSRPTVRAGLRALAAMGVVQSRHGSGTYIPDGPPALGSEPLELPGRAARLHARGDVRGAAHPRGRRRRPRRRARRPISWRRSPKRSRASSRRSTIRSVFLVHDINFHRSVAAASGNPIVASLVEMVSALYYERRRETAARASQRDLRDAAEMHRRSTRRSARATPTGARQAMHEHLLQASRYQAQEPETAPPQAETTVRLQTQTARASSAGDPLMSLFDLSGRTAVVVGGTSGIGRVLALGLADAGADVVATGRRPTGSTRSRPKSSSAGGGRCACRRTPRNSASLERLRDACLQELGGVHIMVSRPA